MKNDNDLSEIDNYEIVSIIFKDNQNKEHLLTKEMQELWKNTFGLKNIDDSFIAKIPQELRKILGKDIQIKKGSLFKIVAQRRENFIPQIKEVLESPEFAINDGNLILGKHLKDNDYFVNISVDKGDYYISISNGIKELNNIKNKLERGAKVIYQSPNANSILQTLLQASLYSANETDKNIIPNSNTQSQTHKSNNAKISQDKQKSNTNEISM